MIHDIQFSISVINTKIKEASLVGDHATLKTLLKERIRLKARLFQAEIKGYGDRLAELERQLGAARYAHHTSRVAEIEQKKNDILALLRRKQDELHHTNLGETYASVQKPDPNPPAANRAG